MRAKGSLLLAFVLVITAACGGDDNGGLLSGKQPAQTGNNPSGQVQSSSGTGACALVTKQEAAAAIGAAVKDGESVALPRQNMGAFSVDIAACSYDAASGTGKVSLQTWRAPQAGQLNLIASSICSQAEKINGIGDSACWLDKEHKELQIFKGGTFIGLTVRGGAGNSDAAIKDLAKKVADRAK